MRADRLVAILLLLQRRGQVTAAQVAEELEVSARTARRDLEALGMAGVPVYPVRGRGGGWRLAGGGRTDLSGLSAEEARALFLVAGPHASTTKEVRAALRKLVRALPEPLRDPAEAASAAVVVDPTRWDRAPGGRPPPPLLDDLQRVVVDQVQARIGYVDRRGAETTRTVHPLGLAAKDATWYLLAGTDHGHRTFRVDRVTTVEPIDARAERPEGFDLADAWREVLSRVEDLRTPIVARCTVAADAVPWIHHVVGTRARLGPGPTTDQVEVELRGHSIRSLAAELAGFGGSVTVHEPDELRTMLHQLGTELVACYEPMS